MTYNLILIATVVISVIVGRALGKNGPKWKAPLIAVGVFFAAILLLHYLGVNENIGG